MRGKGERKRKMTEEGRRRRFWDICHNNLEALFSNSKKLSVGAYDFEIGVKL